MNRPLTGIVYTPGGAPWPNARINLSLQSDPAIDSSGLRALRNQKTRTGPDGSIPTNSLLLATPAEGAWQWQLQIERNTPITAYIPREDASNVTLTHFYALGGIPGTDPMTANYNLGGNALVNYTVVTTTASISGTYQIDLSAATLFVLTITGNVTVTFINAPPSPVRRAVSVTVFLIQNATGGHSVTFTGAMWHNGLAPDLVRPAGVETDLSFVIRNGGEIRGYVAADDMS